MAILANKRSIMTLYSDPNDVYSHRVRLVLAEKGVNVEVVDIKPDEKVEELTALNPYNTIPTLVDRDLVVYDTNIIIEYLDERFPHPPLMPVYPVARADIRIRINRIERDLYSLYHLIESDDDDESERARQHLADGLTALAPVFAEKPFFLSDEFTLVDCCFAPLLWRLPVLGVELPKQADAVVKYAKRLFKRDSFRASTSEIEREMRD